jgi:ferredoxin
LTTCSSARLRKCAITAARRIERRIAAGYFALLLLPFAGRGVRRLAYRLRQPPMLTHSSGQRVRIEPGATVLETLRANRIPHESVCGGRARCTTCRIRVTHGLEYLPRRVVLRRRRSSASRRRRRCGLRARFAQPATLQSCRCLRQTGVKPGSVRAEIADQARV